MLHEAFFLALSLLRFCMFSLLQWYKSATQVKPRGLFNAWLIKITWPSTICKQFCILPMSAIEQ